MRHRVEKELKAKKGYLEKLERIRSGKFVQVKNLADSYGL